MGFYLVDNLNPTARTTPPYSQWGYWGFPNALPQSPKVITVHTAPWGAFLTMIQSEEDDMLSLGDKNNDVRILQSLLTQYHQLLPADDQAKPPIPGALDGVFGPLTEKAVLGFQRYIGLEPTGVANGMTVGVVSAQVASHLERPVDQSARSAADRAEQEAKAAHRRLDKLRSV